jgi:hypothetical protein
VEAAFPGCHVVEGITPQARASLEAQDERDHIELESMREAFRPITEALREASISGTAFYIAERVIPREEWERAGFEVGTLNGGVRIIPNAGKQVRVLFRGPTNSEDLIP